MDKKKLEAMKRKADQDKAFYQSIKDRNAENMQKSQEGARKRDDAEAKKKAYKKRLQQALKASQSSSEGMRPESKAERRDRYGYLGSSRKFPDSPKPPKPKPKKPEAAGSKEKLKKAVEEHKAAMRRAASRTKAFKEGNTGKMHYK